MGILAGLRVLDLSDLRGQMCGKLLADLGMEVIKIEPPDGDPVRRIAPFKAGVRAPEASLRFAFLNAGKQSVTLDLASPAGRNALLGLVPTADVLIDSFRPGTLDRLGLGEEALRAHNPRLVITRITGFGQDGPYRDFECPDIVGLAMGGLMSISGDESLPPVKPPDTQSFYLASIHAAAGTLLALWQRGRDGHGRSVDLSVQEVIASQENMIRAFGFDGKSIRRHGSQHERVAPANIFPTADGYVYLFVTQPHWQLLLDLWEDHPPEMDDPGWLLNRVRKGHAEFINEHLSRFTRRFTSDDLVAAAQAKGIPCLPVNSPGRFVRDQQVQFRGVFQEVSHPLLGAYAQAGFPAILDGARPAPGVPPLLGQDNGAIFAGPGASGAGAGTGPGPGASGTTSPAARPAASSPVSSPPDAITTAPLAGVRVLSFTNGVAGPEAGRVLALLGAEVIKVESRKGGIDSFRYFTDGDDLNTSMRFIESNSNVLSVQLNIKNPEGLRLARELALRSDVVLDNFRPDVLPRIGLGAEDLRALKPDLVVVQMPGMGATGPRSRYGTWGSTLAAFSGMTWLWNHPGQPRPVGSQGVLPDYAAAALAPMLVIAALLRRQRTGEGLSIDMAQMELVAYLLGVTYLDAGCNGREPGPAGNDFPAAAPHGCYPCAGEDRWCVIAVETDEQWRRLCVEIGRPELAGDPRYADLAGRRAHLGQLDGLLSRWTGSRAARDVMLQLQGAGIPAGAVQDGQDLFEDPHLRARDFISVIEHPTLGSIPVAGIPLRISGLRWHAPRWTAAIGAANAQILCGVLGYSPEQLAEWQASGVVV